MPGELARTFSNTSIKVGFDLDGMQLCFFTKGKFTTLLGVHVLMKVRYNNQGINCFLSPWKCILERNESIVNMMMMMMMMMMMINNDDVEL